MVQVTISNNTKRATVAVTLETTVHSAAEQAGVQLGTSSLYIDGEPVGNAAKFETLASLGVRDNTEVNIVAIKNADSAM